MGERFNIDLKSNKEIKNLNKADCASYANNISNAYRTLYETLFNENNGIIPRLEAQLNVATQVNQLLLRKITSLERRQYSTDQYTRKESIELKGLDPNLPDNEIESKVVEILNIIKDDDQEDYDESDIQACHKLKNKKMVICKFVHRKRMRAVINSRKKLKGKDLKQHGVPRKLFIYESMSPHFKSMHWRCQQLKKAGHIKDCWFFNGKYKILKMDDKKEIVIHIDDLVESLMMTEEQIDAICERWKDKPFPDSRRENSSN